jgi:uncharacterized protein YdeI (YjbR/CyaY-like superfamily)
VTQSAKIDAYINRSKKWPAEMGALRSTLLACGLTEEIKWGKPCYSHGDHNIAIMQEMNAFLALMFFKGALMKDPAGILKSQGPNSRSALRIEFTAEAQVTKLTKTLRAYVADAVAIADAGLEVGPAPEVVFVAELQQRISTDRAFRSAFESLTPGRQREYNLQLSTAKQAATRLARIEKFAPKILAGKGFRD